MFNSGCISFNCMDRRKDWEDGDNINQEWACLAGTYPELGRALDRPLRDRCQLSVVLEAYLQNLPRICAVCERLRGSVRCSSGFNLSRRIIKEITARATLCHIVCHSQVFIVCCQIGTFDIHIRYVYIEQCNICICS